jgi:hypothetical protein
MSKRSALVAVLLSCVLPFAARAQEPDEMAPGTAALVSVASVVGGYIVGGAITGIDTEDAGVVAVGLTVVGLAILVGPSIGRALGGDGGGALRRILVRTAVACVGTGVTLLAARGDSGLNPGTLLAIGAMTATGAALVVLGLKDIITTPSDLRELRAARATVTPAVIGRGAGLVLVGTF